MEKLLRKADIKKLKTLAYLFTLPVETGELKLEEMIKGELYNIYDEVKNLSLAEFKAIAQVEKPTSGKRKVSKTFNDDEFKPSDAKKKKLIGENPSAKVLKSIIRIAELYNTDEPLNIKLKPVNPSKPGNLRWTFVCGINGCEKVQSVHYEKEKKRCRPGCRSGKSIKFSAALKAINFEFLVSWSNEKTQLDGKMNFE